MKGYSRIPQSSSTAVTSPSDCLVSYPGHWLGGGFLPLCREAVGVFYSPSRLGNRAIKVQFQTIDLVKVMNPSYAASLKAMG